MNCGAGQFPAAAEALTGSRIYTAGRRGATTDFNKKTTSA